MTDTTNTTSTIDNTERDLRFLRHYFKKDLEPFGTESEVNRLLVRIVASAVCILRGGHIPATVAPARAFIAFALFHDLCGVVAQTPAFHAVEVKRLLRTLKISAEVLGDYTDHTPTTLNAILESFPQISAALLERLFLDAKRIVHAAPYSFLVQDEAAERIAVLESRS